MMSYQKWISFSMALLVAVSGAYWVVCIRPFLWVEEASLQMALVPVVAEGSGILKALPFHTGDQAPSGALLFSISSELLEAKQKHKAAVLEARQLQVHKKRTLVDQSMQNYLALRTDLELGRTLPQTVEQELLHFHAAQKQCDEAQHALDTAKAELTYLDKQLSKMSTLASKELLVLRCAKQVGERVDVGDLVYLLADPSRAWIEALVPEDRLAEVGIGCAATIYLKAYPRARWEGRVLSVGPELLPGRKISVKIALEKGPRKIALRSGLTARVCMTK